jgi:hypothetical protein
MPRWRPSASWRRTRSSRRALRRTRKGPGRPARPAHRRTGDGPAAGRVRDCSCPPGLGAAGVRGARRAGERPAREPRDPGRRAGRRTARAGPGGARRLLRDAVAELDQPLEDSDSFIDPRTATGQLALEYLATVLEGDSRKATDRVLAEVDAGLPVEAPTSRCWCPRSARSAALACGRTGHRRGARRHLHDRAPHGPAGAPRERAPANGRTVICAAVAGNVHDIAVRVLADFFDSPAGGRCTWAPTCPPANSPRRCSISTETCWCSPRR